MMTALMKVNFSSSLVQSSFLFHCLKTLGIWNISRHEIKQQLEVILVFFFFQYFVLLKKLRVLLIVARVKSPDHSRGSLITVQQYLYFIPSYTLILFGNMFSLSHCRLITREFFKDICMHKCSCTQQVTFIYDVTLTFFNYFKKLPGYLRLKMLNLGR